jgi:TolB-like protein/tetratricopeptide (TPR) repeat protein/class 3 adenylate cyclase
MAADAEPDLKLEIAHVLTIDVVAYSTLLIQEQRRVMADLTKIVRICPTFQAAEAAGELIRLPTGDGMALVFFGGPETPLQCAIEITTGLKSLPHIEVRMGIHSGPVSKVVDVNDNANVAGAGIDVAQRVMDCGDAGHILLSKRAADDLAPYSRWNRHLHELGECEVKHRRKIAVVNFYTETLGNPEPPSRWKKSQPAVAIPQPAARWKKRPIFLSVAAALALLVGIAIWLSRPLPTAERSVAVLPFRDLSQAKDQEYFTDGIAELITNSLMKITELRVLPFSSTFALKNQSLETREIGRRLGAAYLLEGSVSRSGDKTRVVTNLIEIATGYQVWAENYDSAGQDVLTLQNDVAKRVAHALEVKLRPNERRQLNEPPTRSQEALDFYLRGRHLLNRRTPESVATARQLFEQSVAADADFALGHTGIAEAYIHLGKIGAISGDEAAAKARPEVTRAIALDGRLADGYVFRGILLNDFDWDWPAAEADYRKAVALDPNNAAAHHWFARHQAQLGNFEEALRMVERAQMLDPAAPMIRVTRAKILFVARRYSEAVQPCHEALQLNPNFAFAYSVLGQARAHLGDHAGAIESTKKYVELSAGSGWSQLELAYAHAIAGNRAEAERIVSDVTARSLPSSPYDRATIYSALHDTATAVEWLEKALHQRSVDVIWIRVDPRLDVIRSTPEFQRILNRMQPRR